jgi:hypothetical protein
MVLSTAAIPYKLAISWGRILFGTADPMFLPGEKTYRGTPLHKGSYK